MAWVVRGGVATARLLMKGYRQHKGMRSLYGFSVQFDPHRTIEELALAGKIPNGQISYADDADLGAALQVLGYTMRLVKSPGVGYHHTVTVLYNAQGLMLQLLPLDAATVLSSTFKQRPNPHPYFGP